METINYHGWKNSIKLSNNEAELVILASVGPRIIHYSLTGGSNVFNVIPEFEGKTGADEWIPYGGHRLWIAPEHKPRSYHPDNGPVGSVTGDAHSVTIANPVETTSGVQKTIRVTLAPQGSAVQVVHTLTNGNVWPITLAPWALSIVANGGKVIIPQEPFIPHGPKLLPARPQVLWNFTDPQDPRWRWGSKYVSLRQDDALAHPQKVGVFNTHQWAAHVTPDHVFVLRIVGDPTTPDGYPDFGSNFETYTAGPFQELETLGPLATLEPGASLTHTQHWYLAAERGIEDTDDDLDKRLLPLANRAGEITTAAFGG